MGKPSVLVLAGGPDAERPVSLRSALAVAAALREAGHLVEHREIDLVDDDGLRSMPGDVIFPVLHGPWGEGGPLQTLLERVRVETGRGYVGCGPVAARLAMDKLATKLAAGAAGVRTARACVVNRQDGVCGIGLPAVVKPVHEGSSVGLMMCADEAGWSAAHAAVCGDATPGRVYMAESMIRGRELTVGLVECRGDGGGADGFFDLPIVEIVSSSGVYDYDAKYTRNDTRYVVDPALPAGVGAGVRAAAVAVAREIGLRHLGRVDFLLDGDGVYWLLEVNTMPGFTGASLLPKAAGAAGLGMPRLVSELVSLAAADGPGVCC